MSWTDWAPHASFLHVGLTALFFFKHPVCNNGRDLRSHALCLFLRSRLPAVPTATWTGDFKMPLATITNNRFRFRRSIHRLHPRLNFHISFLFTISHSYAYLEIHYSQINLLSISVQSHFLCGLPCICPLTVGYTSPQIVVASWPNNVYELLKEQ